MARPPAKELTDRELQIMHLYWRHGAATAQEIRDRLAAENQLDLAYTTVATLVRILVDKQFLRAINDERPFRFEATRPYDEVSARMLEDLVNRVFHGSKRLLLQRLLDDRPLAPRERAVLEQLAEGLES